MKIEPPGPLGRHMILEIWGKHGSFCFWNMDEAASVLKQSAIDAGATIISERWHHFGDGYGFTGVIILSESHISIHTWPERGYAAIDAFYCGKCDPEVSLPRILDFFKPTDHNVNFITRGVK